MSPKPSVSLSSAWNGRWLWVVGVLVALSALGGYYSQRRKTWVERGPIEIPADQLDFRTVWSQKDFRWTVSLKNITNRSISVSKLTASCDCSSITPKTLSLKPGETADVELTLDLRPRGIEATDEKWRSFSVNLVATLEDGRLPEKTWKLTGRVRQPFLILPRELHFKTPVVQGDSAVAKTATITALFSLKTVRAECNPTQASVEVRENPDKDGFVITVHPNTAMPRGRFRIPVQLTGILESGRALPSSLLYVNGEVVGDISILPTELKLGALNRGQRWQRTLTLQSHSGRKFLLEEVHAGGNWQIEPLSDGAKHRHTLRIFGRFQTAGKHSGAIEIKARDVDQKEARTLDVPVTAYILSKTTEGFSAPEKR